jgi:hypothetical protein
MNLTTNESIASHKLRTTAALRLPARSPLNQHEHYKEFQEALSMLKVSVEQVWRFELEQIEEQRDKPGADWQVPSIYACRSVRPTISETIPPKPEIASRSDTPIIEQPSPLTTSPSASLFQKQKSTESNFSAGRKSKRRGCGDQTIKYGTKKALLHLKFRCSKHMH